MQANPFIVQHLNFSPSPTLSTYPMAEPGESVSFCYDESQKSPLKIELTAQDSEKVDKKKSDLLYQTKGEYFNIRGKTYLKDKIKIKSEESAFEFITLFIIEHKTSVWHAAENLKGVKSFLAKFPDDFFFIFVRQVPAKKPLTCVVISRQKNRVEKDSPFNELLMKYLKSPDDFKNKRLKYIPKLENAPWAILTPVRLLGGEKPVLMGNGYLKQEHYSGANYYEVDVDISSSRIARQIAGPVVKWTHKFKVTEAFVLQGEDVAELPEQILCSWTLQNIKLRNLVFSLKEEDLEFFEKNPTPS